MRVLRKPRQPSHLDHFDVQDHAIRAGSRDGAEGRGQSPQRSPRRRKRRPAVSAGKGDTPRPVIDRLFASLKSAMSASDIQDKLSASSIEPAMSASPEEFAAFIKAQAEVREKVIKAVGLKLN